MSKITNDQLNSVWHHRMRYRCTNASTVGVKRLIVSLSKQRQVLHLLRRPRRMLIVTDADDAHADHRKSWRKLPQNTKTPHSRLAKQRVQIASLHYISPPQMEGVKATDTAIT